MEVENEKKNILLHNIVTFVSFFFLKTVTDDFNDLQLDM